MSTVPFLFIFLLAWGIHAVVGLVVATPVVFFARKRVRWHTWELLSLVVPFCVWMVVAIAGLFTGSKSLSNLAIEPRILGLALGAGALARAVMSRRVPEKRAAIGTLAGICVVALGVALVVPALEE